MQVCEDVDLEALLHSASEGLRLPAHTDDDAPCSLQRFEATALRRFEHGTGAAKRDFLLDGLAFTGAWSRVGVLWRNVTGLAYTQLPHGCAATTIAPRKRTACMSTFIQLNATC